MSKINAKSALACSLAALLSVGALSLASCSGGANNVSDQPAQSSDAASSAAVTEVTTEKDYLETLPEKNFSGKAFRILAVTAATISGRALPEDAENGEVINDSLFRRNKAAESAYKCAIKNIPVAKAGDVGTMASKAVLAGDDEYDLLIGNIAETVVSLYSGKCLYDLLDMDYLDLDASWWNAGMLENLEIKGKLFFTAGDISPQAYNSAFVMCFNLKLAKEYVKGDLFQIVEDGKWTIDGLSAIIKDLNHDLDGDGALTKKDFFGYAHEKGSIPASANYVGAGMKLSSFASDGAPKVELDSKPSVLIIDKLKNTLGNVVAEDLLPMFMENRALFYANSIGTITNNFREMDEDYGMIPVPKADEAQDSYYTYMNTWSWGAVCVPSTCKDADMTAFLMEALCYMSYKDVRPAVYDITLKQKVARDEKSARILDMIYDSRYLDFNSIYNFGGSVNALSDTIMKKTDFSSAYAKLDNTIKESINKFMESAS